MSSKTTEELVPCSVAVAHQVWTTDKKATGVLASFYFVSVIWFKSSLVYTEEVKNDEKPWQTLVSDVVYQNPWMTVYEDKVQMPNGREGIYGFVDSKPGVFIIALAKDDKIYLIESFRYPTQKWQWELPTGGIDKGLSPLEAAKHELVEELGMVAGKWTHINIFGPSSNGFMKDTQNVFVAEGLSSSRGKSEDFEAIRATKAASLPEIADMIKTGVLVDGQSLAALMQYVVWRNMLT
jgi:8-oxo-dGTP pyrophosphatase MutT (NUDIX family)